jgi:hypothetical protein
MNRITFATGLALIAIGVVTLVLRFQAPSVHEAIAALKQPGGGAPAITRFTTSVVAPTVLPFALGIAFLVLGLMGRAPSWFGR